jgi:hypothetical protein
MNPLSHDGYSKGDVCECEKCEFWRLRKFARLEVVVMMVRDLRLIHTPFLGANLFGKRAG